MIWLLYGLWNELPYLIEHNYYSIWSFSMSYMLRLCWHCRPFSIPQQHWHKMLWYHITLSQGCCSLFCPWSPVAVGYRLVGECGCDSHRSWSGKSQFEYSNAIFGLNGFGFYGSVILNDSHIGYLSTFFTHTTQYWMKKVCWFCMAVPFLVRSMEKYELIATKNAV